MRRREIMALFLAAASPLAVRAEPPVVPLVGILSDETPSRAQSFEPFVQGLRDLGYIEEHNLAFQRRYSEGNYEILPSLATELVSVHPDVILAVGTAAARAAKNATQAIPIVFARVGDPIGFGLVATLARPGGNLTGLSLQYFDIDGKWLELLNAAVPDAKRVGALWNPSFPTAPAELKVLEAAARTLNLELVPVEVRRSEDLEIAIRVMVERARAFVMVPGLLGGGSPQIGDPLVNAPLPSMFPRRQFVEAGGLMSYGPNYPDMFRRAAAFVDKILRGAEPADIPVEQPTRFELVVNLSTAKRLGLTIPPSILARADEVIE
jgi:putative tryptophan/tyrosine transport system substrate-binding protein